MFSKKLKSDKMYSALPSKDKGKAKSTDSAAKLKEAVDLRILEQLQPGDNSLDHVLGLIDGGIARTRRKKEAAYAISYSTAFTILLVATGSLGMLITYVAQLAGDRNQLDDQWDDRLFNGTSCADISSQSINVCSSSKRNDYIPNECKDWRDDYCAITGGPLLGTAFGIAGTALISLLDLIILAAMIAIMGRPKIDYDMLSLQDVLKGDALDEVVNIAKDYDLVVNPYNYAIYTTKLFLAAFLVNKEEYIKQAVKLKIYLHVLKQGHDQGASRLSRLPDELIQAISEYLCDDDYLIKQETKTNKSGREEESEKGKEKEKKEEEVVIKKNPLRSNEFFNRFYYARPQLSESARQSAREKACEEKQSNSPAARRGYGYESV
jgi:hypothetical protein